MNSEFPVPSPDCGAVTLLPRFMAVAAIAMAGLPLAAAAWQPGTYPAAPARMHSRDFSVDNQSRNDVVAFWHAVYQASEGYEKRIGWNGNYNGSDGKVSRVFADDVERRLNYFRAMCGIPSGARVNSDATVFIDSADAHRPPAATLKADAAQAAAMMLILNYDSTNGRNPAIDHNPAASLAAWSPAAWNANAHGNLAFGLFGPGAVTEYMIEEISSGSTISSWNTLVGHRRWSLLPEATEYATGDQPGASASRPPTNVFYISQKPSELRPDPTPGFVSYPPAGFFPAPINSRYWSLSAAGADFSAATVSMTDDAGNPIASANVKSNGNFGDPALIWEVSGEAASKSIYADRRVNVTVNGISGTGIPTSHTYSVTLINPDRIVSSQTLAGSSTAISNKSTTYTFTPPEGAEALRVTAFRNLPATWKEGAENSPKPDVTGHTSGSYPLIVSIAQKGNFGAISGSRAFNLTFPTSYDLIARGVPEQSFELNRMILPKANAKLQFLYKRGYMTTTSSLIVESSADAGVTWKPVGKPITGRSNTRYDEGISTASLKLPKSSLPIRLRFRYVAKKGTPIYTHEASPQAPTGIFIDDIAVKNCNWLEPKKTTTLARSVTTFAFNARNAGSKLAPGDRWGLALSTKLGNRWFPYGPIKDIAIKAP